MRMNRNKNKLTTRSFSTWIAYLSTCVRFLVSQAIHCCVMRAAISGFMPFIKLFERCASHAVTIACHLPERRVSPSLSLHHGSQLAWTGDQADIILWKCT
ncbi:hypothetical protein AMELA_G00003940 [Ameiurus melas]|uniref:Uncharacterized protein n=1 Tax=Ameiurus melas TaxID=219545 RepID=A0A7J6BFH2_AMEME|nr:hypothetical protein AMELA_G00003940 [Ameiurus melas]